MAHKNFALDSPLSDEQQMQTVKVTVVPKSFANVKLQNRKDEKKKGSSDKRLKNIEKKLALINDKLSNGRKPLEVSGSEIEFQEIQSISNSNPKVRVVSSTEPLQYEEIEIIKPKPEEPIIIIDDNLIIDYSDFATVFVDDLHYYHFVEKCIYQIIFNSPTSIAGETENKYPELYDCRKLIFERISRTMHEYWNGHEIVNFDCNKLLDEIKTAFVEKYNSDISNYKILTFLHNIILTWEETGNGFLKLFCNQISHHMILINMQIDNDKSQPAKSIISSTSKATFGNDIVSSPQAITLAVRTTSEQTSSTEPSTTISPQPIQELLANPQQSVSSQPMQLDKNLGIPESHYQAHYQEVQNTLPTNTLRYTTIEEEVENTLPTTGSVQNTEAEVVSEKTDTFETSRHSKTEFQVAKMDFHNSIVNKVKSKVFACRICDYKSAVMTNLKVHLMSHTGVKPFTCEICDYKCTTKSQLKVHLRTHSGEKPFACEVCGYRSAYKGNLNVHIKIHTH